MHVALKPGCEITIDKCESRFTTCPSNNIIDELLCCEYCHQYNCNDILQNDTNTVILNYYKPDTMEYFSCAILWGIPSVQINTEIIYDININFYIFRTHVYVSEYIT